MNRLPALTGLRGVAALMIVAYHSVGNVLGVTPGGFFGVDIFFVLSGFLITSLLLQETSRAGRVDYLAFYMRRALRLLPALFLVCLAAEVIALLTATPEQRQITQGQLIPSIFYFANFNELIAQDFGGTFHRGLLDPNWSLSIEEQFYVIWPITLAFLLRFNRRNLAIGLVLVAFAEAYWGSWLMRHGADATRVGFGTDTHSGGLLMGAALAIARFEGLLPRPAKVTVWLAAVVLALMVWQIVFFLPLALFVVSICAGILVAWAADGGEFILASKPMVLAGTISYGMYLWQGPLLVAQFDSPTRTLTTAATMAVLTIVAAAAMYRWWERPFLKLQKRWRRSGLQADPSQSQPSVRHEG